MKKIVMTLAFLALVGGVEAAGSSKQGKVQLTQIQQIQQQIKNMQTQIQQMQTQIQQMQTQIQDNQQTSMTDYYNSTAFQQQQQQEQREEETPEGDNPEEGLYGLNGAQL